MKSILMLSLFLSLPLSALAKDIKCSGVGPGYHEDTMNYEVTLTKEDGYKVKDFYDEGNSSSFSTPKYSTWKEGGVKVIGVPGLSHLYLLDGNRATLKDVDSPATYAKDETGKEKVYKYVDLTCE